MSVLDRAISKYVASGPAPSDLWFCGFLMGLALAHSGWAGAAKAGATFVVVVILFRLLVWGAWKGIGAMRKARGGAR